MQAVCEEIAVNVQKEKPLVLSIQECGGIAKTVSTPAHPLHLDAGFSISGWLAVLLTFVLARVFAQGALMREDLEATV